jgi:hypothetical protein
MNAQVGQQTSRVLPAFTDFILELTDRLQRVTDAYLDDFDEHQAFVYLVAELFETTDESRFAYTDGARDGGIDFFVQDVQSYSICQCKCPDLETLESSTTAPSFDRSVVHEIVGAVGLLKDDKGAYDVKKEIARLRTDFQRDFITDPDSTLLTATVAILGELTEGAQRVFEAKKQTLRDEGIVLKLITWKDIYRALHQMERPSDIDFSIYLSFDDLGKELLRQNRYCYMLAHAEDFYQAWREHGWNLFDWNVRLQLHRSPVNRRIIASLSRAKDRKVFHHLNNGILITCRNYTIDETRRRIRVDGPQIINGCQTVCAIRDAYEDLSPYEQQHFREHTRVQVKIIKNTDPELIGRLVITTNDQNAMSPRNLKSNTAEQKDLQRQFRERPESWFYQRKDGEWQSLADSSTRVRWFRKSDYAVRGRSGRHRYRRIDNGDLTRYWYAWIGYSEEALRGGVRYFEQEDVYDRVFRSRPNEAFWREFGAKPHFSPTDDHFDPGIPSPHQYLLAVTAANYISAKRVGWRSNKEEALRRALEQGELEGDLDSGRITSTQREIDEYLERDTDYWLNIILNNMREVLIELMSFALAHRYGDLGAARSRTLLEMSDVKAFHSTAFAPEFLPKEAQDGESILGPSYAFLQHCVKQYYFENRAEIRSAPRLKSYLWRRSTVRRMRAKVIEEDRAIVDWTPPWKLAGKTFTGSLPNLEQTWE